MGFIEADAMPAPMEDAMTDGQEDTVQVMLGGDVMLGRLVGEAIRWAGWRRSCAGRIFPW